MFFCKFVLPQKNIDNNCFGWKYIYKTYVCLEFYVHFYATLKQKRYGFWHIRRHTKTNNNSKMPSSYGWLWPLLQKCNCQKIVYTWCWVSIVKYLCAKLKQKICVLFSKLRSLLKLFYASVYRPCFYKCVERLGSNGFKTSTEVAFHLFSSILQAQ